MDPILDETSLVPCPIRAAPARVTQLARTLGALDELGARRVLRSVRDAADRDIGEGRGLRAWCFDKASEKDAGRLIATRLAAQPFVDGADGLFAAAEGKRAVEATVQGTSVLGAGLAALTEGQLVLLASEAKPAGGAVRVALVFVDDDGERKEAADVLALVAAAEVAAHRAAIVERVDRAMPDGQALLARLGELFPRLRLGELAREQIGAMRGNETVFRQLIRHLRALDAGVQVWCEGKPFEPVAVTCSVESQSTLDDGTLGPMRDFPTPPGYEAARWTLHTKITGGAGARLYYRAVRKAAEPGKAAEAVVLVGYFGEHLPTTRYRT